MTHQFELVVERLGDSFQLTILAPPPVIPTLRLRLLIMFFLTGDTQPHAGHDRATGFGNVGVAFFAMGQ